MIAVAERFIEYKYRDIEDRGHPFWTAPDKSTREYRPTPGGKKVFIYENRAPLYVAGLWHEDGRPNYYRKGAPGVKGDDVVFIQWDEKGRLDRYSNCTTEEAEEVHADMVEYWKQSEGVAE